MNRRILPALAAALVLIGCASSAKLTRQSEQKLAKGNAWKAWELATRALDKEPGNPDARHAATQAGAAIAEEWQRKIEATAALDSLQAAEQVLEFAEFRLNAARYATIPTRASWNAEERVLRQTAARVFYAHGVEAFESKRPKQAYLDLSHTEAFVPNYLDAAELASQAMEKAISRVAIAPFRSAHDKAALGTEVANRWRANLTNDMAQSATFTRVLGSDAISRNMTVSQLSGMSRPEVVRLGRKAGAQRVVWGSVGNIESDTDLRFFRDIIWRRFTTKDSNGNSTEHWVEVPIEVVSRIRNVSVSVDYEVIAVPDGSPLAQQRFERTAQARVVWTSFVPEGEIGAYVLVTEAMRASNPTRAKDVETRWKNACGEGTTLDQVLQARRSNKSGGRYTRDSLPYFIAGAAFVFLEDLPPADDLALAALAKASGPLRDDLLRLDPMDDADLLVKTEEENR